MTRATTLLTPLALEVEVTTTLPSVNWVSAA